MAYRDALFFRRLNDIQRFGCRGEKSSQTLSLTRLGESVRGEQKTNPYTYRDFAKIRKRKKRKGRSIRSSLFESGSPSWARTNDLRINSPSLYRLSYRGIRKYELYRAPRDFASLFVKNFSNNSRHLKKSKC